MKLLNLGCGEKYHKEWINIDFISNNDNVQAHNLLSGIPLKDNSVNVVYHSHLLEHFSKADGFKLIQECYRVLDKDGIIRIVVPDLETIIKEYLKNLQLAISGDKEGADNYEWIMLELFDQMVRNNSGGGMKEYLYRDNLQNEKYIISRIGSEAKKIRATFLNKNKKNHNDENKEFKKEMGIYYILKRIRRKLIKTKEKVIRMSLKEEQLMALKIGKFRSEGEIHQWMYDRYSLSEILKNLGFKKIIICSAFESEIPNWISYELDVENGAVRKPDSVFIEAVK